MTTNAKWARTDFDIQIGDTIYPLVRDPDHIHPPEVHARLGTDTVTGVSQEAALRRFLDAADHNVSVWFRHTPDGERYYTGRDFFGVGIVGETRVA